VLMTALKQPPPSFAAASQTADSLIPCKVLLTGACCVHLQALGPSEDLHLAAVEQLVLSEFLAFVDHEKVGWAGRWWGGGMQGASMRLQVCMWAWGGEAMQPAGARLAARP